MCLCDYGLLVGVVKIEHLCVCVCVCMCVCVCVCVCVCMMSTCVIQASLSRPEASCEFPQKLLNNRLAVLVPAFSHRILCCLEIHRQHLHTVLQ